VTVSRWRTPARTSRTRSTYWNGNRWVRATVKRPALAFTAQFDGHGRYRTCDGRWVAISASATSIAERVMTVVGRPDIAAREWFPSARERVRHADELDRTVADWIGAHDLDEVMAAFQDAGAAIAPIYDIEQVVDDPHVRATGTITTVDDEDLGPLRMQNLLFRLLGSPGRIRFAGRGLGQDNEQVYAERLGLDSERLARLREDGVV
jgi:crotonobetainyl-CoA:carnitine CoA-transferase CaiB-like acyl-CoA transferase